MVRFQLCIGIAAEAGAVKAIDNVSYGLCGSLCLDYVDAWESNKCYRECI